MKTAIIIGATSGIGRSLAEQMAKKGYQLGLAGRRQELLHELKTNLGEQVVTLPLDVTSSDAQQKCESLWNTLRAVDVFVYCSGTGYENQGLQWAQEKETIEVNALGFAALANTAYHRFANAGSGHLVVVSSVAANIANGRAPAYNASKAFVSNYVKGLRAYAHQHHHAIVFTEIQPGFVDTPMMKSSKIFWAASSNTAAKQILAAIEKKRTLVYVTRRWRLIAWVFKLLPEWISRRTL